MATKFFLHTQQKKVAMQLLNRDQNEGKEFLKFIITIDETWIPNFES